jgi:hypothetical protein
MQPSSRSTLLRSPRALLFGLLFLALVALAVPGAIAAPSADEPDATIPPGTLPKPDDGPPLSGLLNVLHLAPVAADLDDTAVVLCNEADDTQVGGPLRYEEQTGYTKLYFGVYDWYVALADVGCGPDNQLLDLDPFTMRGNSILTLVIYGGANSQPLNSVLIIEVLGSDVVLFPFFIQQP